MDGRIAALALGAVGIGLGAGGYYAYFGQGDRFEACRTVQMVGREQIGGPFSLIDTTGSRVSEAEVIDGLTLIYFGYTFCPDVCPFDLSRNAEAVAQLEEAGIMVKPVFITIDPARDTPQEMAKFTEYMHPRMVGLTGTQAEIDAVTLAYRAYSSKQANTDEGGEDLYLMDHSVFSYLMHPDEGLLQVFGRAERAEELAATTSCYAGILNG
ncbi:MAG: SCO family protein [Paracoccaceae bacterium]